jgi:hypothetical protein
MEKAKYETIRETMGIQEKSDSICIIENRGCSVTDMHSERKKKNCRK